MKTFKVEVEIPLIERNHRYLVADGEVFFIGCVEASPAKFNIFAIDDFGNRIFSDNYDTLEKLSVAAYDFLGDYELFSEENSMFELI